MNSCPLGTGSLPTWPAGLTVFCDWMALTISGTVIAKLGQLVGFDPETHGVLAGAENLHAADAVETRDLVAEIDVGDSSRETARRKCRSANKA